MPDSTRSKSHFVHPVQVLIDLYENGELPAVKAIHVDEKYGLFAQIVYQNDTRRYIQGTSVDVNPVAAGRIAVDKDYTRQLLRHQGYRVPAGDVFFSPRQLAFLENYLTKYGIDEPRTFAAIPGFVEATIGYPCFIKPNDGSRGRHVYKCHIADDITRAIEQLAADAVDAISVEEAVHLPEYRAVVYRDEVIACYSREAFTVVGDGQSTITELVEQAAAEILSQGRRINVPSLLPQIQSRLARQNLTADSVPAPGTELQVLDAANLSAGGRMVDTTDRVHSYWHEFCVRLARDMNLVFVGVDLLCADITRPATDYAVIEINAAPGLRNYASIGTAQQTRIRDLYRGIFNTPLSD
jgi:D-alanine-D-alanine ligase-like ATP-grasp enzyme